MLNEYIQKQQNTQNVNRSQYGNQTNQNQGNNDDNNITSREEMDGPPLRRPTTPMTNLSSTSNSQLMLGGNNL